MKKQTSTHSGLVLAAYKTLGNGLVKSHQPTEFNLIGQSGVHTFIDDVIDIVMNSNNEAHAYQRMWQYLAEGSLVLAPVQKTNMKEGNS